MGLSDLTRDAVLAALDEYDHRGQEAFLTEYGLGEARRYVLIHDGREYDPAAVVRAAHHHQTSQPLTHSTNGAAMVGRTLDRLGFAVRSTKNPDWDWQEVVLACDLVADNHWHELRTPHPRVVELSGLLQSLPIHPVIERSANFRSPDAVSRKTTDLATAHPDYQGARTRGGKTDRKVIDQFLRQPDDMRSVARAIREAAAAGEFDVFSFGTPIAEAQDEIFVEEGGLLFRRHLERERNPGLRAKKIAEALSQGWGLGCQICGFDFAKRYGPLGEGYIECHHVVPLHATGARTTRLRDLILICANCHRMIHRGIPWLSPEQLRKSVDQHSTA